MMIESALCNGEIYAREMTEKLEVGQQIAVTGIEQ